MIEGFTLYRCSGSKMGSGGGVSIFGASPTIRDCRFVECHSSGYGYYYYNEDGGGAAIAVGFPHFDNCVFHQCSASGNGGAVLIQNYAGPTFTNCQFTDNWAQKGGAIYVTESSAVVLNGCDVSNNQGWWYGGGLYLLDECVASIVNSTIVGNYGSMQGGGIYSQWGTVDLSDSVVEANHASSGGGMSFVSGDE